MIFIKSFFWHSETMPKSQMVPSTTPSLRAAGMRQTPQREAILKVLEAADQKFHGALGLQELLL
jgi:Fe2+ or Zn2+ uptake regulation protein